MRLRVLLAALLLAPPAAAEDRFLPGRPEVKLHAGGAGESLFTVRGKDAPAAAFLTLLVDAGELSAVVDPAARVPLTSTILSIDLHERRADFVIELIAAAAGVDLAREGAVFRLIGPPLPGSSGPRGHARWAAERFYNLSLTRQAEAEVTAAALRGLAELNRRSGDQATACANYETLLSRFPRAPAAAGAEVLLADCFMALGDRVRARQVLHQFLDRCPDQELRDHALRRLVTLFTEQRNFAQVEDLREALLRLDEVSPRTLLRVSDAAMMMLEAAQPEAAVRLLHDLWLADPEPRAVLGPVLALALTVQTQPDPAAAAQVLRLSAQFIQSAEESATALLAYAQIAHHHQAMTAALVFGTAALRSPDAGPSVALRSNLLLGEVYRALGMTLRARRHFYDAEQLSSTEEAAHLALESAAMALEEGEPERARLLFQEIVGQESVHVEAELGIARAMLEAGDVDRARQVVARLLRQDHVPVHLEEAVVLVGVDCLEATGRFQDARRLLAGDVSVLATEGGR